jgi:glycosyltransferase involved in cell wall biosynthesis
VHILCPTYWYPEHANDIHATYVHDINRHLVMLGHEVTVVTPRVAESAARESFDGVDVIRFSANIPADLSYGKVAQTKIGAGAKIRRLTAMASYVRKQYTAALDAGRQHQPDVIHGHWAIPTGPAVVAAARKLGCPSVITMHGGDVYVNHEQGYNFPTRWYVRPVLRRTLRGASGLTAISDDCRTHALNAGANAETIEIIMNGADLRRFSPGEANVSDYGRQMVFACRQLIPRKGIRFLVQAVAMLKTDYPELQLVVAGDGMERDSLETLSRDLGIEDRVHLIGWVANADLPTYFRSAIFSVIPSIEEGFGIPAAEAMGCEIPVIASDAGGLPEVVEDGVTGFVVEKASADALAAAMRKLLDDQDLRRRFGAAGRQKALAEFDWLATARAMESMYEKLIKERNR